MGEIVVAIYLRLSMYICNCTANIHILCGAYIVRQGGGDHDLFILRYHLDMKKERW